jgi:hypothetical protein
VWLLDHVYDQSGSDGVRIRRHRGSLVSRTETAAGFTRRVSIVLAGVTLSACAFHVESSDSAARKVYSSQVQPRLQEVASAARELHPSCDVGGSKQACAAASAALETALSGLGATLSAVVVPPAYEGAHRDLVAAVKDELVALEVRSRAILNNDERAWSQGNADIGVAGKRIDAAIAEYPNF